MSCDFTQSQDVFFPLKFLLMFDFGWYSGFGDIYHLNVAKDIWLFLLDALQTCLSEWWLWDYLSITVILSDKVFCHISNGCFPWRARCSLRIAHIRRLPDIWDSPAAMFHLWGRKWALRLGDTPILQGVLVPSAGGSSGNTSLWAPSSVPVSSLSCQTGYQTEIPASIRLHLSLTCWQREGRVFSYLWIFFLDS